MVHVSLLYIYIYKLGCAMTTFQHVIERGIHSGTKAGGCAWKCIILCRVPILLSNRSCLYCMGPVKSVLRDAFESDTEKNENSAGLMLSIMSCSAAGETRSIPSLLLCN
jgi:hypothetical protein